MWNYPDNETLEWTKNLKIRGKIFGDGSGLTGVAGGVNLWVSNATYIYPVTPGSTLIISGADIRVSPVNTFLGKDAGKSTTGLGNTAIGHRALFTETTGLGNTAIGSGALLTVNGSNYNTAIGNSALRVNTASNNTAVGYRALNSGTGASNNTAVGYYSLQTTSTGSYNTALGGNSLSDNTTGNYNTAIGNTAGQYLSGGISNATASGSLYLGAFTRALRASGANEIVIGFNAVGAGSNKCVLGDSNLTAVNTAGVYSGAGYYTGGTISGAILNMALTAVNTNNGTGTFIIDNSTASFPALTAKNNTNYAHGGNIALFQMVNGTDSGTVVKIENAGTGTSLDVNGLVSGSRLMAANGFNGTGAYTNFTISGGIILAAS